MQRRAVLILILGAVAAVGMLTGMLSPHPFSGPNVAHALDCQPINDTCGSDITKTSAIVVSHTYSGITPHAVQPDSGETWDIEAEWRKETPCDPGDSWVENASVRVDWNGSQWVLSDKNLTDNIVDISICNVSTCSGGGSTHGYQYKLIVDVNDPETTNNFNLRKVTYTTTEVDAGDVINMSGATCSLGSSVSPTSQTFSSTDEPNDYWHSSRCTYSCSINGTSVNLTYN